MEETRLRTVAARVTLREYRALQEAARRTGRTVSQVLRELIRRAEIGGPDIRLREWPNGGERNG